MRSGVKQGCVLAPTLFGIYFASLLHCAFDENKDGIYIRTRADGSLFNFSVEILIRQLLFKMILQSLPTATIHCKVSRTDWLKH